MDDNGNVYKVGGSITQRWNDRIFRTEHSVVGGQDYYDIEASAAKYILSLTSYTEFQLYISEPNETEIVNIRFLGQSLRLKRSSDEAVVIGSLRGKAHCYTLDVSTGYIWTDDAIEIQLIKSDISDLKTKTTSIYAYKGTIAFEDLPTTGQAIGDTYDINNDFTLHGEDYLAGSNVAWNGSDWDVLASNIPPADKIPYEGRVNTTNIKEAIDLLAGELEFDALATAINKTLDKDLDVTYTGNLSSLTITIPECEHGYYAGINFKTRETIFPINIVNNSGYPLLIIDGGVAIPNILFSTNKTYNLSFHCDGINLYCYYVYVGA